MLFLAVDREKKMVELIQAVLTLWQIKTASKRNSILIISVQAFTQALLSAAVFPQKIQFLYYLLCSLSSRGPHVVGTKIKRFET